LQKTNDEEKLCWQLTWVHKAAVLLTAKQWPTFPSAKVLESLVGEKLYYGHFLKAK